VLPSSSTLTSATIGRSVETARAAWIAQRNSIRFENVSSTSRSTPASSSASICSVKWLRLRLIVPIGASGWRMLLTEPPGTPLAADLLGLARDLDAAEVDVAHLVLQAVGRQAHAIRREGVRLDDFGAGRRYTRGAPTDQVGLAGSTRRSSARTGCPGRTVPIPPSNRMGGPDGAGRRNAPAQTNAQCNTPVAKTRRHPHWRWLKRR
jgi:hypothetical protein